MNNPAPLRYTPMALADAVAEFETDPLKKRYLAGARRRSPLMADQFSMMLIDGMAPYDIAQAQADGYPHVEEITTGLLIGVRPLMYTVAIVGPLYRWGYLERWCYHDLASAWGALKDWRESGFEDEPQGWHRHIPTDRRRDPDGTEIILP